MTHDLHGLHVREAKETVGGILQGLCSMPPEAFTGDTSVFKLHNLNLYKKRPFVPWCVCETGGKACESTMYAPHPPQICLVQSSWQALLRSGLLHKTELNSITPGCTLCNLYQGLRTVLYSSIHILAIGSLAMYIAGHVRQAVPTAMWMAG